MSRLLFVILLLFCSLFIYSQNGYLFVKKGYKKKKIYTEGSNIMLQLQDNFFLKGTITLLRNDTIFLNGQPVPVTDVKAVILNQKEKRRFHINPQQILLITGGVALVTAGLTLSKQSGFGQALTAGLVIGYGPLLVSYISSKISFRRKKYIMGKKFHLQELDFYLSPQRGF